MAPLVAGIIVAGCGGGGSGGGGGGAASQDARLPLSVAADTALRTPFTLYANESTDVQPAISFADPTGLAARLRGARKPDLVAVANMAIPTMLYDDGLVEKPLRFGSDTLEVAYRPGRVTAQSLAAIAKRGVRVAIGGRSTDLGTLTRSVIGRLPGSQRTRILANVTSDAATTPAIVRQLQRGTVDAAFLFRRDVLAANARTAVPATAPAATAPLAEISLPPELSPTIDYGIAIVKGTPRADAAELFVYGLLSGASRAVRNELGGIPPN